MTATIPPTSFHTTAYGGAYAGPVDLDGYAHTTAVGWLCAPMDWGMEPDPTDADDPLVAELAADTLAALARADEQVARWRDEPATAH